MNRHTWLGICSRGGLFRFGLSWRGSVLRGFIGGFIGGRGRLRLVLGVLLLSAKQGLESLLQLSKRIRCCRRGLETLEAMGYHINIGRLLTNTGHSVQRDKNREGLFHSKSPLGCTGGMEGDGGKRESTTPSTSPEHLNRRMTRHVTQHGPDRP